MVKIIMKIASTMMMASPAEARRVKKPPMSATPPSGSTSERNLMRSSMPADMPSGAADHMPNAKRSSP
jgi:hypothetical protein